MDSTINTQNSIDDEVDIIDLEEFGKEGKPVPKAKKYIIRIDKIQYTVIVSSMTGQEILTLAGKIPVERFMLTEKMHNGNVKKIELGESVDFRAPGIERFMTLPLDQQEG
jgi:hypothetical protein